jgi:ubiquinone/menaquinone biosynthesis C-methylase UbiE
MSRLPRLLEPEVMDTAHEARDYDAMDHAAVNRVFVEDFLAVSPDTSLVLDVGTGTAQIPIELCRADPSSRVLAVDAAAHMLTLARSNIARAGFTSRIEPRLVDAKRLPLGDGIYTAVMSNSIVHHIPNPLAVLREMVRVLRPGGVLFVRDLLRPDDETQLEALVRLHAGTASEHGKAMFRASLHAALTLAELHEMVISLGRDPAGVTQTSDRHWTWICTEP